MPDQFTHDTYLSPFTWRYGSEPMRAIWSEAHKRRTWRRIWVALAEAQHEAGLVTAEQVADLRAHQDAVDIPAAHAIEREIQHDLMAEVRVYASQCPVGGGIIHLGATSADIEDNADVLRIRESLEILKVKLQQVLTALSSQIERWADTPCMAYTHLQPAEPTTVGYRLAGYAQDLLNDFNAVYTLIETLHGKGFTGAVGTAASYTVLLGDTELAKQLNSDAMQRLNLYPHSITSQTYPRKQDIDVMNVLSGIAMSLYKFGFDLRFMQSPAIGEWSEPFGKSQVGSSAMPFKRNPINAEKLDSLGRLVASLVRVAWDNAAHSLLERTLDDSANRREMFPTAFLAVDEMLMVATRLIEGLQINEVAIARNLEKYGTFAATERVLMEAVKRGADRQAIHEVLREASMQAWSAVNAGEPNPLPDLLSNSAALTAHLSSDEIRALMDARSYVGTAPERARILVEYIRSWLDES